MKEQGREKPLRNRRGLSRAYDHLHASQLKERALLPETMMTARHEETERNVTGRGVSKDVDLWIAIDLPRVLHIAARLDRW